MNLDIIKDSIQKKLLGKSERVPASPEPESKPEFIKILNEFGKSMVSLPSLSRDLNVARRNLVILIKLKGGKPTNKADMFFLKADEREAKFESDMAKQKSQDEPSTSPTAEKKEEEPQDPLQKIMTSILNVFGLGALGKYFSIFKILKSLKIIGITFLLTTITSGIYEAFKKFFETGDILASIKEGFVEFINFITLGVFGKENIGKLFDDVINFLTPIAETVGNFIGGIGKFFSEKFKQLKRFFGLKEESQPSGPKTEEARKSFIETLNEDIIFLKERKNLLESLVKIKNEKLKSLQEEERLKRIQEAEAKTQKIKDAVNRVGSKILKVLSVPSVTPTPSETIPPTAPAPITGGAKEDPDQKSSESLAQLVKVQPGVDISEFKSALEDPVARMAAAFKKETGKSLLITSGYRSNEKQKELFDKKVAELGGNVAAAKKMVAEPMPPLGQGKGSLHLKGLAIDINSKGDSGLNILAGTRDNPTGWLEKFGLTRPVPNEDWHVQPATLPAVGDGKNAVNDGGKVINLATGKPNVGEKVSKNSVELAQNKREQEKRQTPTIINAVTINNTTNVVNKHRVEAQPA